MRKTILSLLLLLFVSNLSFTQEATLTKKQMYKDFDQFVKIIEDCNAQLLVRKAVTGYDNLAEIKKLRKGIDTITCLDGFNRLLNKALGFVLDAHTTQTYIFYPEFDNLEGIDTAHIRKMSEYTFSPEYIYRMQMDYLLSYFPIPAIAYNYNYYMIGSNKVINRNNKADTLDVHFMRLISYNGEDFSKYVEKNSNYKGDWDYKLNKFSIKTYSLPRKGILKTEQDGKIYEFNLTDYSTNKYLVNSLYKPICNLI